MKKSIKHSVFLHGVQDAQDIDEKVDYVQVQIDGCQDVLLRWQLMHQHVSIENNEPTEQQSSGPSDDQLHGVIVEEKLKDTELHSWWNVSWLYDSWQIQVS